MVRGLTVGARSLFHVVVVGSADHMWLRARAPSLPTVQVPVWRAADWVSSLFHHSSMPDIPLSMSTLPIYGARSVVCSCAVSDVGDHGAIVESLYGEESGDDGHEVDIAGDDGLGQCVFAERADGVGVDLLYDDVVACLDSPRLLSQGFLLRIERENGSYRVRESIFYG